MLEDLQIMIHRLNTCCRVYRHINMKFVKTIVLNFHLTCYKRIKGSCQHDQTLPQILFFSFHLRPPNCEQLTDNHAADLSDERFERIYRRRFSTLENVRRKGPSSCGTNLP